MKGPDGEKVKARIRETLSRRRPELYGKTGVHRSGVAFKNWPMLKLLAQGALAKTVAKSLGLKGPERGSRDSASREVSRLEVRKSLFLRPGKSVPVWVIVSHEEGFGIRG